MKLLFDKLDTKIINYILRHERFDAAEMAKLFKTTPQTVYSRINKLKKLGVIKGIIPKIDAAACGYSITCVLMVKLKDNRDILEFLGRIEKEKYVVLSYALVGLYDALLILKFDEQPKISKFVERIRKDKRVDYADLFYVDDIRIERLVPYPLS